MKVIEKKIVRLSFPYLFLIIFAVISTNITRETKNSGYRPLIQKCQTFSERLGCCSNFTKTLSSTEHEMENPFEFPAPRGLRSQVCGDSAKTTQAAGLRTQTLLFPERRCIYTAQLCQCLLVNVPPHSELVLVMPAFTPTYSTNLVTDLRIYIRQDIRKRETSQDCRRSKKIKVT